MSTTTSDDEDATVRIGVAADGAQSTVVQPSRGAETLTRISCTAIGALVVAMLWVMGAGNVDVRQKVWASVIGLSAIMAVTAFAGFSRAEGNKTRLDVQLATQAVREEMRGLAGRISGEQLDAATRITELTARTLQLSERSSEASTWRRESAERMERIEQSLAELTNAVGILAKHHGGNLVDDFANYLRLHDGTEDQP